MARSPALRDSARRRPIVCWTELGALGRDSQGPLFSWISIEAAGRVGVKRPSEAVPLRSSVAPPALAVMVYRFAAVGNSRLPVRPAGQRGPGEAG